MKLSFDNSYAPLALALLLVSVWSSTGLASSSVSSDDASTPLFGATIAQLWSSDLQSMSYGFMTAVPHANGADGGSWFNSSSQMVFLSNATHVTGVDTVTGMTKWSVAPTFSNASCTFSKVLTATSDYVMLGWQCGLNGVDFSFLKVNDGTAALGGGGATSLSTTYDVSACNAVTISPPVQSDCDWIMFVCKNQVTLQRVDNTVGYTFTEFLRSAFQVSTVGPNGLVYYYTTTSGSGNFETTSVTAMNMTSSTNLQPMWISVLTVGTPPPALRQIYTSYTHVALERDAGEIIVMDSTNGTVIYQTRIDSTTWPSYAIALVNPQGFNSKFGQRASFGAPGLLIAKLDTNQSLHVSMINLNTGSVNWTAPVVQPADAAAAGVGLKATAVGRGALVWVSNIPNTSSSVLTYFRGIDGQVVWRRTVNRPVLGNLLAVQPPGGNMNTIVASLGGNFLLGATACTFENASSCPVEEAAAEEKTSSTAAIVGASVGIVFLIVYAIVLEKKYPVSAQVRPEGSQQLPNGANGKPSFGGAEYMSEVRNTAS